MLWTTRGVITATRSFKAKVSLACERILCFKRDKHPQSSAISPVSCLQLFSLTTKRPSISDVRYNERRLHWCGNLTINNPTATRLDFNKIYYEYPFLRRCPTSSNRCLAFQECNKKMFALGGLKKHMTQVHKTELTGWELISSYCSLIISWSLLSNRTWKQSCIPSQRSRCYWGAHRHLRGSLRHSGCVRRVMHTKYINKMGDWEYSSYDRELFASRYVAMFLVITNTFATRIQAFLLRRQQQERN